MDIFKLKLLHKRLFTDEDIVVNSEYLINL